MAEYSLKLFIQMSFCPFHICITFLLYISEEFARKYKESFFFYKSFSCYFSIFI